MLSTMCDWEIIMLTCVPMVQSIIMIRRVVVHRPLAVPDASVGVMLQSLTVAGDDLRSALVKNALLALAECFEYLGRGRLEPLVARNPEMLDMLLRRSVCEKKFLRDAAVYAVQRLVQHLACLPLVERAASYATNKNARLCANAAKIIASSLTRLTQEEANGPIAALAQSENAEAVHVVYRALTVFREGKDSSARTQATLSFKLIGEFVGREQFEGGLKASLSRTNQQHMAARILKEVFPSAAGNDAGSQVRRGSLRDRMQLERAH